MKKALGQTVRDLKREVNKKVLKVPSIEQKVLDATSNEPWGPHGSHLADIAQATRNYHEYQMVMSVIWKRINDTGKNWRHVYKALIVLEYLVAHGSERVIDEIREHAYQISTLSDFQYIDSSGRDQGSNIRKKSQGLVVLVNDKDRIQEARQKAAATRDKYRNTSMGGIYKPSSYSSGGGYGERYDDDRYEGRYGYGREREWGSRDDDRYGKYGDYGSRDGDRYGRESEDSYAQDGYRDDDSRGRSRSVDDYNYGSRSRSADRDRDQSYEDDGQYSSSRVSGVKADDHSQDGRRLDRKYSEPSLGGPPSYEEAVGVARSPTYSERDGEPSAAPAHASKSSSPPQNPSTSSIPGAAAQPAAAAPVSAPSPVPTPSAPSPAPAPAPSPAPGNKEFDGFDEFDPRGPFSAVPTSSNGVDMDFLGSLSDSFSSNSLAIVPNTTSTAISESDAVTNSVSGNAYPLESTASIQFEDPFGDGPFKAISSTDSFPAQPSGTNRSEPPQLSSQSSNTVSNFGLGDTDILADILPPSGPSPAGFQAQTVQPVSQTGFQGQIDLPGQSSSQASFPGQMGPPSSTLAFPHQSVQPGTNYYGSFNQQLGSTAPVVQPMAPQNPTGPHAQYNTTNLIPELGPQAGFSAAMTSAPSLPASANSLAIVPQPAKDTKFETKSTIWVDTLNRGLVNLNISGSKTNPLADIGVDFDAINRKDRRMEKPSQTPVVSTITMGKAMGSGSGIGRAGAGAIRGAPNPMMGSGMHIGMSGAPGSGMGMGGGRGSGMGMVGGPVAGVGMGMGGGYVNQPMGGMGMGMGQGFQMQQQPTGFPPRSFTPGVYNTVMGPGNYIQQPYNGGYR